MVKCHVGGSTPTKFFFNIYIEMFFSITLTKGHRIKKKKKDRLI